MRRCFHVAGAVVLGAALAAAVPGHALGQSDANEAAYDGRFTFVRLRWGSDLGFSRRGGWGAAWNHDYPRAERTCR